MMRILLGILFWSLAVLEGLGLLFMLFVSLAAGPGMAENGDLATPLFWNVILPLAALIGAVLLFALARSVAARALALLVVLMPVALLLRPPSGQMIITNFADPGANRIAGAEEPSPESRDDKPAEALDRSR